MIGLQRDSDGVSFRDLFSKLCECDCAASSVFYRVASKIVCSTGADLDDTVGPCFSETLERCVQSLRA